MKEICPRKILLLLFLFCLQTVVFAQSDTVTLKEIRVSSVANSVQIRKIPRQVEMVLQKDLKSIPASSLGDVLEQLGGLDVRQRGAFGMQADLSLDGGSFDQALVLINGIPVNDPQTGHHDLDQALSLIDIKRVEIVRGPASRWFGPNAFSGAINIITENKAGNHLTLDAGGGQYGLFSASALAAYRTGKVKNETSVSFRRSDGYRINTDFKNLGFFHQSFFTLGGTAFNFQTGYSGKAFGANSFYTARFPNQFETVQVLSAGLGLHGGKKLEYRGNIYWRRLYDRFELFREGTNWFRKQGDWYVKGTDSAGFHTPAGFFPYSGPNFHRTDATGAEGSAGFRTSCGKTTAGFSWRNETIWSNVLGEPARDTLHSPFDKEAYYNRRKSRQLFNVYLNQLYQKQNFSLSAGLNLFYNAQYGTLLSPGLDFSWFVTGNLKTYFSVNRAIRLPTFTDLYYQGPDHISNPHLKPEKVYGFSAGMQYFMKKVRFSASVFYRVGYDVIDWVKKDAAAKWESKNLTRLNTFGVSVSLGYTPQDASSRFIQAVRFSYHYLTSDKNTAGYVSLYALDYLHHHANLYLQHAIARHLSAGWTFSVRQRNGYYFDYEQNKKVPYGTVFLMNTKIRYVLPHFVFYLQANNLLNRTYRDIGSVVMPGIWVSGGVQYHISL